MSSPAANLPIAAGMDAGDDSEGRSSLGSRRFLERLVDSSWDGIFAFDSEFRLLVFNPAMESLWGRGREEVLGRSLLEAFPFLVAIGEDQFFSAALAGESIVARDRPYRVGANGAANFFGARYSPILGDEGDIIGGLAVVRDTTDHTYNASRIDRDREHLHALMGSVHDLIFFKDMDHQYTAVNNALAEFLGLPSASSITGKTDHEIHSREIAERFQADDERVLMYGESIANRLETIRRADGSVRWLRTNRAPILDDDGNVIGLVGTARDTTDQEEAESHLRMERELLQTLIDNVPDQIFFKDAEGRFTRVNRTHAHVLGHEDPRDVVGLSDADFYPAERAAEFAADERRLISTGQPLINKIERQTADGHEPRWTLTSKVPVFDPAGSVVGLVGTARDVTQIHQAEEELRARTAELEMAKERAERAVDSAREASRLKSEFLSTMSHELRTPMNAIIGYSHLLLDGLDGEMTEQQTADVSQIARSADQLLNLINDVLDLSKIEAGRMDLVTEQVNVGGIARQVADALKPQATAKGIALTINVRPNVQEIEADPDRVRQILLNLVSNAVKFTESGEVNIDVRGLPSALEIQVVDTGIGIPEEALAYIFDEFRQADGSTTRRFGGTGLGLAIARKLARLHGGDIEVTSKVDRGSTFILHLPAGRRVQTAPLMFAPEPEFVEADDLAELDDRGVTVLLVEDDMSFVNLARRTLELAGATVIHASRGMDAIRLAGQLRPDLVLLDIGLEDNVDGWKVLLRLRAKAITRDLPVVILSAHDERGKAATLGATDYMVKPIGRADLLGVLARFAPPLSRDVLIVEPKSESSTNLARLLSSEGIESRLATDGDTALTEISRSRPGLMILDLAVQDIDGFTVLDVVSANPELSGMPVIVVTAMELTEEQLAWLGDRSEVLLSRSTLEAGVLLDEVNKLYRLAPLEPAL